jgi:hypothetical protein
MFWGVYGGTENVFVEEIMFPYAPNFDVIS